RAGKLLACHHGTGPLDEKRQRLVRLRRNRDGGAVPTQGTLRRLKLELAKARTLTARPRHRILLRKPDFYLFLRCPATTSDLPSVGCRHGAEQFDPAFEPEEPANADTTAFPPRRCANSRS